MKIRSLSALALIVSALYAQGAQFEVEENFDDDSHFTQSQTIPDGWELRQGSSSFSRYSGMDLGYTPKSGTYLFGANNRAESVIFTPMMEVAGNVPYRIEFSALMPGGKETFMNMGFKVYAGATRDIDQMTLIGTKENGIVAEWTDYSYAYTPDADGEYGFAIEVLPNPSFMMQCGFACFDDFFFSGSTPEQEQPQPLVPNPDNLDACVDLPYFENFSEIENFDGGNLPKGWKTVGTTIWRTVSVSGLPAHSGEWYMVAPESNAERDERAYTPFFNLKAGIEYTISFYSHFDGYIYNDTPFNPVVDLTIGCEQDADFHSKVLYTMDRALDAKGQWVAESVKFTPEVTGPYCFSFLLSGPAKSGFVAIDSFSVNSPVDTPRAEPKMSISGIFSWQDNSLLSFDNEPTRLINLSKYADSYQWDVANASVSAFDNGDAHVTFSQSGDYQLKLSATNSRGTRTATKSVTVQHITQDTERLLLLYYDPNDVTTIDRGSIPAFDTDPEGLDYISGFNHYYRTFAQRYDLTNTGNMKLKQLMIYLTNVRFAPMPGAGTSTQDSHPVTITFYGADENGNIDEGSPIASQQYTIGEFCGMSGIGGSTGEPLVFNFDTPVDLKGTVYVTFAFSDQMLIDPLDPLAGRSFFSLQMQKNLNKVSTLYVKPYNAPENSSIKTDGTWCTIDAFDDTYAGIGLSMVLVADYDNGNTSVSEITTEDGCFNGHISGNTLHLDGVKGFVAIYTLDGRLINTLSTSETSTTIDCSAFAPGVYIATTEGSAVKFVK